MNGRLADGLPDGLADGQAISMYQGSQLRPDHINELLICRLSTKISGLMNTNKICTKSDQSTADTPKADTCQTHAWLINNSNSNSHSDSNSNNTRHVVPAELAKDPSEAWAIDRHCGIQERSFDYFAIRTLVIIIIMAVAVAPKSSCHIKRNCFKNFHKWLIKFDGHLERSLGRGRRAWFSGHMIMFALFRQCHVCVRVSVCVCVRAVSIAMTKDICVSNEDICCPNYAYDTLAAGQVECNQCN